MEKNGDANAECKRRGSIIIKFQKGCKKHEKMKKLITLVLAMIMVFSISSMPVQAAVVPETPTAEINAVGDRWNIAASQCREMYNEMCNYNGWEDELLNVLGAILDPTPVGGAYSLALVFRNLNYNLAKNALKQGADSGKGCTMLIHDNAVPTIIANN